MTQGRAFRLLFAATVALVALAPAAAQGATVKDQYICETDACVPGLGYVAGAGEANDVTLSRTGDELRIEDPAATIAVDPAGQAQSCTLDPGNHVARCPAAGSLAVTLGDGNDKLTVSGSLGNGIVAVVGGPGADVLKGGDGREILYGAEDDDDIDGGGGDDAVLGGPGADQLAGGSGRDDAFYSDHSTGVSLSLDGQANDGAPGENDRLGTDVEGLSGSSFDDVLVGDDGPNLLVGGGYSPALGFPGAPPQAAAAPAPYGVDTLRGLGGDDWIDADDTKPWGFIPPFTDRSSADPIDCGDGADRVFVDLEDQPVACETVTRCTSCKPVKRPPKVTPPLPPQHGKGKDAPRLIGVARVGRTLTCRRGVWTGASSITVAWSRNGKPIKGATAQRYRLTRKDRGKRVRCTVVAKAPSGVSGTVLTAAVRVR